MQHLAIIMDGNRRFAASHGMGSLMGHHYGRNAAETCVESCIKNGIPYLSLYTFSLENFKRSSREQEAIFSLLLEVISENLEYYIERDVRICFIGDRSRFPLHLRKAIKLAESKSKECSKLTVYIMFCYGSQQELVAATRSIAEQVKAGLLDPQDITENTIMQHLWTYGAPPPDLIIRTGGRSRLSNFMLFQGAYSELAFVDCLWPDFDEKQLDACLKQFNKTERNFGV